MSLARVAASIQQRSIDSPLLVVVGVQVCRVTTIRCLRMALSLLSNDLIGLHVFFFLIGLSDHITDPWSQERMIIIEFPVEEQKPKSLRKQTNTHTHTTLQYGMPTEQDVVYVPGICF